MKHLLAFIMFIFLFSCEKEDPCWHCEMRQTKKTTLYFTFCDKTEEEIRNYEEINTFTHNFGGEFWHQTTTCKLK